MASNNITPKYYSNLEPSDPMAYLMTQDGKEYNEFVDYTTGRTRLLRERELDIKPDSKIKPIRLSINT